MPLKSYTTLILLVLLFFLIFSGKDRNDNQLLKPLLNDDYNYIDINEIYMWIGNNGDGSHDPNTDGSGFYWPGGEISDKSAIFEDGLIWGCKIGQETVVNGNTWQIGLQAGKILSSNIADDPADPKYRVYKVRKDWEELPQGQSRDHYEKDYLEWPVHDGAPWVDIDGDGVYSPTIDSPEYMGDEMMWYVSNDLDTARARSTYGSDPIGLEFQTTTYGFNSTNLLKDVIIKNYLIINKSNYHLDSMYVGYWSDDDLGRPDDDFAGCDTILNLGFTYNARESDQIYGSAPPAVGHMYINGPIIPSSASDSVRFQGNWITGYNSLPTTSFWLFVPPGLGHVPLVATGMYYNLKGYIWNGNPIIDPISGSEARYIVPGDPVRGEGWYEGPGWPNGLDPDDRRQLLSSGPFNMAPGDSQEVTIAILIAQGENYLDSITELKKLARSVQISYDLDFDITPEITNPETKSVTSNQSFTLYWETNAENFDQLDPILQHQNIPDSSYTFEGYRIWQFRDQYATEPKLLATFDLKNDVNLIYGKTIINGHPASIVAIDGPNEGLRRSFTVSENGYGQRTLNNGNPYYFGVTAYAYSALSDPSYIESKFEVIEVIPGMKKIDQTHPYESGENIIADHISGSADGAVELLVVDPNVLTGDQYQIIFEGPGTDVTYSLLNMSTNDTVLADCTNFIIDTVGAKIIDGYILKVHNKGMEGVAKAESQYAIRDIMETSGPGGEILDIPVNVINSSNSTGKWSIFSYGHHPTHLQNMNINDQVGYNNYEIRFTSTGSEYYPTGSSPGYSPWREDDSKADDRVPFEIWDIGITDSDTDDFRLSVKTLDDYVSRSDDSNYVDQDGKWSQLENDNWEPIFAFFQDSTYIEPLPEMSGRISNFANSRFGIFVIHGSLPETGTVIRLRTWKPFSSEDVFSVIATAPNTKDFASAKTSLDDISVFPNPFFGFSTLSGYIKQDFVRFTNMPTEVTLRIFSMSGSYVRQIEKNDDNPWLDWNLKNNAGQQVASGIYIAHLEMPNIGEKVMKLAVILENQR